MKKTTTSLTIVIGVLILIGGSVLYVRSKPSKTQPLPSPSSKKTKACTPDIMLCPDGSSVIRNINTCSFPACKQELPSYMIPASQQKNSMLTPLPPVKNQSTKTKLANIEQPKKDVVTLLKEGMASLFSLGETPVNTQPSPSLQTKTTPAPLNETNLFGINETRFSITNNTIVDNANKIIYTLPKQSANSFSSGVVLDTHAVNAVQVNQVAPVVGAIPVDGLPGKYYVSVNSFGNTNNCQFSNRIYILDTVTGKQTLMYEENSMTLSKDDPRSCNSEMFLLATQGEKLILKYHTLDTNMVCDSTWSEPEKTWYLNVTKPENGTKRFYISGELYSQAEHYETACRAKLTTTP